MSAIRGGAWSLIIGSVITCLVFAFHPSHIDPHPLLGSFTLSQMVHSAAILAAPLMLFGMWEMTRWLGADRPGNALALTFAALAMVLTVNAAVVSSFVVPAAAEASAVTMPEPSHDPSIAVAKVHQRHAMQIGDMPPLVRLAVSLNRGLAQAHVALLSIALVLFALGLWRQSRGLAAAGLLVGAFPLLWQLSGRFSPETHTMPLIVFTQSAWIIAVAARMLARSTDTSTAIPA